MPKILRIDYVKYNTEKNGVKCTETFSIGLQSNIEKRNSTIVPSPVPKNLIHVVAVRNLRITNFILLYSFRIFIHRILAEINNFQLSRT